jgi:hypothetical protein
VQSYFRCCWPNHPASSLPVSLQRGIGSAASIAAAYQADKDKEEREAQLAARWASSRQGQPTLGE